MLFITNDSPYKCSRDYIIYSARCPGVHLSNIHARAKDSNACMNFRCTEYMHVVMAMGCIV